MSGGSFPRGAGQGGSPLPTRGAASALLARPVASLAPPAGVCVHVPPPPAVPKEVTACHPLPPRPPHPSALKEGSQEGGEKEKEMGRRSTFPFPRKESLLGGGRTLGFGGKC